MLKKIFMDTINVSKHAFKNKDFKKTFIIIIFFVFLNTGKTTLFNYFLIPQANKDIFYYKLGVSLLVCTLIYTIVFSLKSRWLFIIVFALQGLYMFTNISYFLYYHSYLHVLQWISLFKEAFISATHLANPKSAQLLVVFIDIPLALYILFKFFKPDVKKIRIPFLRYIVILVCIILLVVTEFNNYKKNESLVNYISDRYTGEAKIVERYGTTVNGIINIMQNYSETKMIEHLEYGPEQEHKEAVASINSKPNYVFIQVESMDANIVRHEYGGSYVMPNLKSLAENNIYYPYTLSYHKGGGTSDAEFSIINSVEPLDSFPAIKLTAYKHPNSYVGKLAGAYYTTMAFHGNVGTFYNRNIAFSKMGFKKFYDISSMDYKDEGWGAPDDKVFSYAFKKISQTRKPFMSYIITMTSHGPFESARHYYNNSRYDSIKEETVKNYFNSMSYVDKSISDFVKNIRQSQPNTYIFIVGDHTPNINTPDYFQASFIDGETYFEFVPLIIITPDNKKYTETKRVASFLDISPSIMDSSGISFKIKSSGSNLLDKDQNMLNIPLKGKLYDRTWLFDRVSTAKYNKEEPLWKKYLPSFIKSDLIEKHNRTAK